MIKQKKRSKNWLSKLLLMVDELNAKTRSIERFGERLEAMLIQLSTLMLVANVPQ